MFFNGTLAAIAEGQHVRSPKLVFFDFDGAPMRVWEGDGTIVVDGDTYIGLGVLGAVSDIPFGINDGAESVTFMLSGVDAEIVALAREEASLVRGRDVTIFGAFFDAEWQLLDSKFPLFQGVLDVMSYAGTGPAGRKVSVTAENIWTGRNMAAFAYYTDRDQQARFAGDKGLIYVVSLANKETAWPFA